MQKPKLIQFHNDCFRVLCADLNAVSPEEGCALLIGDKASEGSLRNSLIFRILLIWPCSNIWGNEMNAFDYPLGNIFQDFSESGTKRNHFLLDPREQLSAQKWSRNRNLEILGIAHSHPQGESKPSKLDLEMSDVSQLMIIMNRRSDIKVWWISNNQPHLPEQIPYEILCLSDKN